MGHGSAFRGSHLSRRYGCRRRWGTQRLWRELFAVVGDGFGEAVAEVDQRFVAEGFARGVDVREGHADVAGSRVGVGGLLGVAGELGEDAIGFVERDAFAAGYVEDAASDALGWSFECEQVCRDRVGDVGEVAGLFAVTLN